MMLDVVCDTGNTSGTRHKQPETRFATTAYITCGGNITVECNRLHKMLFLLCMRSQPLHMLLVDMTCSAYRNHIRCNRYPCGGPLG